jgi:hypothetical protein
MIHPQEASLLLLLLLVPLLLVLLRLVLEDVTLRE